MICPAPGCGRRITNHPTHCCVRCSQNPGHEHGEDCSGPSTEKMAAAKKGALNKLRGAVGVVGKMRATRVQLPPANEAVAAPTPTPPQINVIAPSAGSAPSERKPKKEG